VVDWTSLAVSAAGYSVATSYNLYWDAGSSGASFVSLVGETSDSLATTFTVTTGVTEGGSYQFKVRAKNIHGFGSFSSVATIVASSVPDTPSTVTTAYDSNGDVVVTWTAPDNNGAAITAYYVVFADEA
jgi:large repetitive protein